jgi:hypothetical protein
LWDLRQQLLALHGLRQPPPTQQQQQQWGAAPQQQQQQQQQQGNSATQPQQPLLLLQLSRSAGTRSEPAGLMASPAVQRFFTAKAEVKEVPQVRCLLRPWLL